MSSSGIRAGASNEFKIAVIKASPKEKRHRLADFFDR